MILMLAIPWSIRNAADAAMSINSYDLVGEALYAADRDQWSRTFRLIRDLDDPLAIKFFHWLTLIEDKRDADFDELARFVIENPTWPRVEELQELAESRLTDSADRTLTLELFEDREPLTTRGRVRLAEALFAAGEHEMAVLQIKHVWARGKFTATEEKSFLGRHKRHLTEDDHDERLRTMLWERQWRAAKRMLPRVSKDHQRLAKARLALQQRARGVDQIIAAVPTSLESDSGLAYDRIRWRRLKKKHTAAVELLLDPPEQLVRHDRWWFERSYQIRRAIDQRNFDRAYQLASRHGQLSGGDYAEAEWLAGWLALRFIDQPETAFRHFVRLYDRVMPPVRQARAAYWAGRASNALGDNPGATAWYRRAISHHATYYGQLAAQELDEADLAPEPVSPMESERASFYANELVQVASMLIAAGATNHLDPFLLALSDQAETASQISMIGDLAVAGGRPSLLARVGRRAAFEGNVHSPAAFPIPRIDELLTPSTEDVEPSLLLALARQESMFKNKVASNAGARGLMQLLPSTARIVARKAGEDYDLDRLVGDHNYNALLGGHYLGSMLERFDGEPALALAAYNAGPLRVKRWIEKHGDPRTGDRYAIVDWVELIPFAETRNYVQRVLEGYQVYDRHLANDDIAMVDFYGGNGRYPPPMPAPKPRGDNAAIQAGQPNDKSTTPEVHIPRFKPRDALPGAGQNLAGGASSSSGLSLIRDVQ